MLIQTIPVGVLQCNCVVLACDETRQALVVDPGDEPARILEAVRERALEVRQVLHTHGHLDHIMATDDVIAATGAVARLHRGDRWLWAHVDRIAESYMIPPPKLPPLGPFLADNEIVRFGRHILRVLHTPGHTPGSCCFVVENDGSTVVLSGDTLFRGRIGQSSVDRPTPNRATILASIRDRLLALDDQARVIPGHGAETSIGNERTHNPFLSAIGAHD